MMQAFLTAGSLTRRRSRQRLFARLAGNSSVLANKVIIGFEISLV